MSTIDREEEVTRGEKTDVEFVAVDKSVSSGDHQDGQVADVDLQPVGLLNLSGIKSTWNAKSLAVAWGGALALSFVVAYDNNTFSSFAPYATSDFTDLSLLGLIGTIQGVISAVMQQPLGKLADVYGRFELFTACIVIVTVGQVMLTASTNINVYAAAQIFFVVGLLGLTLMLQFLAGDSSDLKNRLIISAIPIIPVAVTSWTAAPIVTAILNDTTWRWGFGIFAILFPVFSVPLLGTLWWHQRKSTKARKANGTYTPFNHWLIFQQLDPIGFIWFTGGLTLVLLPLSLASSNSSWKSAHIIIMLVIGGVSLIVFGLWEWRFAKWPLLPLALFKDRTITFGGLSNLMAYLGMYTFQSYLFAYLVVDSNLSVAAATNVLVVQPFVATFGMIGSGLILKYWGRPKWVIVAGFCVNVLGMGLTLRYRDASVHIAPLIVGQGLFGLGQGMVYTIQTAMQASVPETSMAQVTALYTTLGAVGDAFGAAISGSVWINVLPQKLLENLPAALLPQLADIEGSVGLCLSFAWGTPERVAINTSYDQTMRILLIAGLCCEAGALLLSLFMDDQNLKTLDESRDYGGVVIGKTGGLEAIKERVRGANVDTSAAAKEEDSSEVQ
ncbi:hypothetical protein A1O3_02993 [Capronia epimyces CBS 606.96]|uniref:Major facilitator superfamily (MFS) profile domain-containing protein n=1 Tax=Capronia epimyces CBS 606.96 TaxID=1182542 RepID=W9YL24_9EURO|nr:uncharacterized protein A1O3_02993 [Capronia epimyces CBS 606.96]EXJ89926.1 hypothetical protein A1O3_02993 [Capronia epimyces CBS 606.96]